MYFLEKVLEIFANTKINHTFALAIRKNSNNKGLIQLAQQVEHNTFNVRGLGFEPQADH